MRSVLRYSVIFLLLAACASEPDYPYPYAAPGYTYVDMYGDTTYVPLGSGSCASYDLSVTPPPWGMYPCPLPLTSTYPGYGYATYPGYYGYPFYPAFGVSLFGVRGISRFHGGTHVGRPLTRTPGHTHSGGRRGRR